MHVSLGKQFHFLKFILQVYFARVRIRQLSMYGYKMISNIS